MPSSYIAYLDLLGTRGFCDEKDLYYKNINKFAHSIETLSPILGKTGKIGMFSDCVYVESTNLRNILQFLAELRTLLIGDDLFFNAAIKYGTLGVEHPIDDADRLFGVKFTNKDIADIYCKQTTFRGVGIWIDPDMQANIQTNTNFKPISLFYLSKEETNNKTVYTPKTYIDLPLFAEDDEDAIYFGDEDKKNVLSILSRVIYIAHNKSSKYSAYYISLIVNILRCCNLSRLKWNIRDSKFEAMPIEFDFIYQFLVVANNKMADLPGLDCLCLAVLNEVYNTGSLSKSDKIDITMKFVNQFDCIKNKYIKSLDSVPEEPFTENNRQLFIQYCNSDMAGQFVDDIKSKLSLNSD